MNLEHPTNKLFEFRQNKEIPIKGVIHVGSHLCEERNDYKTLGIDRVLWFEANHDLVEESNRMLISEGFTKHTVVEGCLSDMPGKSPFYVTDPTPNSSLLFPYHGNKDFGLIWVKEIDTITFEEWQITNKIDISLYNCLVIDVQAAELKVLNGFGKKWLSFFDFIIVEIWNNKEKLVYLDQPDQTTVENFLNDMNFKLTYKEFVHSFFGNALFEFERFKTRNVIINDIKRSDVKVSVFGPWARPKDWQNRFNEFATNKIKYEIVIAGHKKPDFELPNNVTFIYCDPDPGMCRCAQIAANHCVGEIMVQLPDDCSFSPFALDLMYEKYVKENDYKCLLLPHWGVPEHYEPEIRVLTTVDGRIVQWGSCAGFSRKVFMELNGFDRHYNAGPYDADLQNRIYAIGGRYVWVDGVFVNEDKKLEGSSAWWRNNAYFENEFFYKRWLTTKNIDDGELLLEPRTPFESIKDDLYINPKHVSF